MIGHPEIDQGVWGIGLSSALFTNSTESIAAPSWTRKLSISSFMGGGSSPPCQRLDLNIRADAHDTLPADGDGLGDLIALVHGENDAIRKDMHRVVACSRQCREQPQ